MSHFLFFHVPTNITRNCFRKISTDELKTHVINYINSLSRAVKLLKCKNIDDELIKLHIEEIIISGHSGVIYARDINSIMHEFINMSL